MTTLSTRLRGALLGLLLLLVGALVACTPGGAGSTTAPSVPAVTTPSAAPSSVGGPGSGY